MLGSFTRDLAGAPDSYDAFFLVESFLETLGHLVVLQFLENLNVQRKTHVNIRVRKEPQYFRHKNTSLTRHDT